MHRREISPRSLVSLKDLAFFTAFSAPAIPSVFRTDPVMKRPGEGKKGQVLQKQRNVFERS